VALSGERPGVPIGFAHRGARAERRENTIDAFARALELGATGLESDAWITADGIVVLDHDGVTGPLWRRRAISTQVRSDLPGHIPSLPELYEKCGTGYELSLDIKDPAAVDPIVAVAAGVGALGRLWLCYGDWRSLAGWSERTGRARLVLSTSVSRFPEGFSGRIRTLHDVGVAAVNLRRTEWDGERVAGVQDAGLCAFGWDAQSTRQLSALIGMGLDGIYSDHVGRMMAAIAAHSGRRA
jgi:glycerophosphoryl diester phosphodiesterase